MYCALWPPTRGRRAAGLAWSPTWSADSTAIPAVRTRTAPTPTGAPGAALRRYR